jgi:hypothetical protein
MNFLLWLGIDGLVLLLCIISLFHNFTVTRMCEFNVSLALRASFLYFMLDLNGLCHLLDWSLSFDASISLFSMVVNNFLICCTSAFFRFHIFIAQFLIILMLFCYHSNLFRSQYDIMVKIRVVERLLRTIHQPNEVQESMWSLDTHVSWEVSLK